ncbi:MAG: VOC family protein [Nitrososphaerota archaeon]|nr:VOC family protein [Nitrososphaerota archaeon]
MVARTIVHFEIPAQDVGRLSKFYSDVFGWKFEKAGMPGMDYWLITTGPRGKSVGGGMYAKMGPQDVPKNYIGVDDIDKAIEAFKAAGGSEVVGKQEIPNTGWSFIGTDPEGNAVGLFEANMPPPRRAARRAARPAKRKSRR